MRLLACPIRVRVSTALFCAAFVTSPALVACGAGSRLAESDAGSTASGGSSSSSGSVAGGSSSGVGGASSGGGSSGLGGGSGATGSSGGDGGNGGGGPLVGTWVFQGDIPNHVNATFTVRPDGTFSLVEQLSPITLPPHGGGPPAGCATTDTFLGTYVEGAAGAASTVVWTYTGGTVNAVLGCADPSNGMPGTPLTPGHVTAYTKEGILPPSNETYQVTGSSLVLTPNPPNPDEGGFLGTMTLTRD